MTSPDIGAYIEIGRFVDSHDYPWNAHAYALQMSNSCSVGIFMRSWPTAMSLSSSHGWTGNASEPTDLTYFRAGPWEDVSSRMGGAPASVSAVSVVRLIPIRGRRRAGAALAATAVRPALLVSNK